MAAAESLCAISIELVIAARVAPLGEMSRQRLPQETPVTEGVNQIK